MTDDTVTRLARRIAKYADANGLRLDEENWAAFEAWLEGLLCEAMEQQRWELLNKHLDEFINEAMKQRIKDAYTRAADLAKEHICTSLCIEDKVHLRCNQWIAHDIEQFKEGKTDGRV